MHRIGRQRQWQLATAHAYLLYIGLACIYLVPFVFGIPAHGPSGASTGAWVCGGVQVCYNFDFITVIINQSWSSPRETYFYIYIGLASFIIFRLYQLGRGYDCLFSSRM
ncbi:hypothetical protein F4781DRAFT_392306, partial [Annulohypoxylon bovei var. microspora]